jgi:hypothetical protein
MSEYQYYEFVAIDEPLTSTQMAELRERSSRATITPTSFINVYNWGDLKGDPHDWMRRYFDAYVYSANWCSCNFALRFPCDVFDRETLEQFETEDALVIDSTDNHWIIHWSLNEGGDYDRFAMDEGPGWMGRLLPIRDELLRGDLRPLYIGWLAGVTSEEIDDDALEPEPPPGLAQLTGPQQALAEFLEVDPDLLTAASIGAQHLAEPDAESDAVMDAWLAALPVEEMRAFLKLLLQRQPQQAERQLKSRFFAWRREASPKTASAVERRSVGELRALANEAENARLRREAEERARQEEERRKEREKYLAKLAADFDRHWESASKEAERGVASGYDSATRTIIDLSDAYALKSDRNVFDQAMQEFMASHSKRSALVRRLVEAGLWRK